MSAKTTAAEAAAKVVLVRCGDPVATHLIEGLARPGGTVTGISDACRHSRSPPDILKPRVPAFGLSRSHRVPVPGAFIRVYSVY